MTSIALSAMEIYLVCALKSKFSCWCMTYDECPMYWNHLTVFLWYHRMSVVSQISNLFYKNIILSKKYSCIPCKYTILWLQYLWSMNTIDDVPCNTDNSTIKDIKMWKSCWVISKWPQIPAKMNPILANFNFKYSYNLSRNETFPSFTCTYTFTYNYMPSKCWYIVGTRLGYKFTYVLDHFAICCWSSKSAHDKIGVFVLADL